MDLAELTLDQWLQQHTKKPIEFDLGSSTGPQWTMRELLSLADSDALETMLDMKLTYSRSAGSAELREAIAEMQGVSPDHVLVTIGAAEALFHLYWMAAEPGANIIVPFPCFPPYVSIPRSLGLEPRFYRLRRENGFRLDLDEVKRLVDSKTRILMVNLPNNPTGAVIGDADLRALHDFAAERGIQFVSDEVHSPVYHGPATATAARLPAATTIGDFSKAFSLPGLRLGWMVEPNAGRRSRYINAREHITISNSPVMEMLAAIATRNRKAVWERTRKVANANLKLIDNLLAAHAGVVTWIRPRGGMTGFPWFLSGEDARPFCIEAVRQGLLLVPGDCFAMPDHFRLGFGVSHDWYPQAMERLSVLLGQWGRLRRAS